MPILKAKIMGFYGKRRIRPGETFVYPDGKKLPKWASVEGGAPKKEVTPQPEKTAKEPARKQGKAVDSDLAD